MKITRSKKPGILFCVMIQPNSDCPIMAARSLRDLVNHIVRVKSSNVWGYNIDTSDGGVGDVVVQFKNESGGPGDVYQYFDVPVRVYRRWAGAPSKGHYFWQNIRNNFKYRKLTGDKRGKLANAVN